jgi:transcriptional regulator with XRE-family HTH domain
MRKPKKSTPIRQVREATGKSQKEFAHFLGIGVHLYHSLELGRVGLSRRRAESISQKTGATPISLDPSTSKEPRDLSGNLYTPHSWEAWNGRHGFRGAKDRIQNVLDWARFLGEVADEENKLTELSFELADCLTNAMEKYDLRPAVEHKLARKKETINFMSDYGHLRRNQEFAKEIGFSDDKNIPDDEVFCKVIKRPIKWDPQSYFPSVLRK